MGAEGYTEGQTTWRGGESRLLGTHSQNYPFELKSLLNLGPLPAIQLFRISKENVWKGQNKALTQLSSNFLPGPQGCSAPDSI